MAVLSGYFGYYWFNIETTTKCLVQTNQTTPINHIPIGYLEILPKDQEVVDVSYEFDIVIALFFTNSVTGTIISFYHVLSIYILPVLLKFSYPVGVFNKLNLVFGILCMFLMHTSRLSQEGKVCSGDFIESDTKLDSIDGYLIHRGRLMYGYMVAFWTIIGILIATSIVLIIAAIRTFY